jgi:Uncharacterized conserved protein
MRLDTLVPPRQTPRARVAQLPTRVLAVQRMVELHGLSYEHADDLEAQLHGRAPTTRDYLHGLRFLEHELDTQDSLGAAARVTRALEQDLAVLTRGTPAGEYLGRVAREAAKRAAVLREAETMTAERVLAARSRINRRFVVACPHCGLRDPARIEVHDVQTRAGDEAARQHYVCQACSFHWLR